MTKLKKSLSPKVNLSQIAWYQFKHQEFNGKPIKGVDMHKLIYLYEGPTEFGKRNEKPSAGEAKPYARVYGRYVDIVLGEPDTENLEESKPEEWIELKSLKRKEKSSGKVSLTDFGQWSIKNGGRKNNSKKYHKQFFLDRAAFERTGMAKTSMKSYILEHADVDVTDVTWWFHNFEVEIENKKTKEVVDIIESYSAKDVELIEKEMEKLPIAATKTPSKYTRARNWSVGIDPKASQKIAENKNYSKIKVESLTYAEMMKEFGEKNILPKIIEQIGG